MVVLRGAARLELTNSTATPTLAAARRGRALVSGKIKGSPKLNNTLQSHDPSIDVCHRSCATTASFGSFRLARSIHNVPESRAPCRPEGDTPRIEQHILRIQHLLPEQVTTRLCVGSRYAKLSGYDGRANWGHALTVGQRRRTLSSSVVVLQAMSQPSRLARPA